MEFIKIDSSTIKHYLAQLNENDKPLWGSMSAQQMVEHLSETLNLAMGKLEGITLEIPEEKVEKAQHFLRSEHPMPQNFKASFAPNNIPLVHESLEKANEAFILKYEEYKSFYSKNKEVKNLHPYFGMLDYQLWERINLKHINHHFAQFNLI